MLERIVATTLVTKGKVEGLCSRQIKSRWLDKRGTRRRRCSQILPKDEGMTMAGGYMSAAAFVSDIVDQLFCSWSCLALALWTWMCLAY